MKLKLIIVGIIIVILKLYLFGDEYTVYATREGLIGHTTATGLVIQPSSLFAALPSRKALHQYILVTYKDKSIIVPVLDVGPWSTRDPYWITNTKPLSESGKRIPWKSKARNKAGIDLSDATWDKLEIPRRLGIVIITWEFAICNYKKGKNESRINI